MENLMYMAKARRAYESGEYKLCIVLLRRTPLHDPAEIQLFVNACYFGWKSGKSNLTLSDIYEAYSGLFAVAEGSTIRPYEFVRLSHIYIKNGSLLGAMKTMQYAAVCGHLSSTIAVLQTWTILRKIGSSEDPRKYGSYLCELAPLELPEESENGVLLLKDTDIPLYVIYLHCAVHLHSEMLTAREREMKTKLMRRKEAMIAEAYTYVHRHHPQSTAVSNAWYRNHVTWTEMARYLQHESPCILLAEESFFVAFTCSPLRDDLVDPCLDILDAHNRPNEKYALLEKAYRCSPWNVYCRKLLAEQDPDGHYKKMFFVHHKMARRIQSTFRGFYTRNNWEPIYDKMKAIKAEYFRRINRAQKLRTAALQRHFRYRLRTWREHAQYLKRLRFYAAQAIQMLWRCYRAKSLRTAITRRRVAANKKYLVACEVHYGVQLVQILGEWNRIYKLVRNNTRADLIKKFLKINKTKSKLMWAAKKLGGLLAIRRKHQNVIIFAKWRKVYLHKRLNHATVTIRFFVRNILLRLKQRKAEEKLRRLRKSKSNADGKIEIVNIEKIAKNLDLLLQKKMWKVWRSSIDKKLMDAAKILLARRLPVISRRRNLRETLNRDRALREFIRGQHTKIYTLRIKDHFSGWRHLWAILVLQRCMRMFLARCRMQRRIYQLQRADYLYNRSWKRILYHRYHRLWWCVRQTRLRIRCMASRIVRWWLRTQLKGRLMRLCKRKWGLSIFLEKLHVKYLRKGFGQLTRMVFAQLKIKALNGMVKTCEFAVQRFAFFRLARNCYEQRMLQNILHIRLKKRLQRSVFSPTHTKGWTYSSISGYCNGNMSMMNWSTGKNVPLYPYWPPLLNKPSSKVLIDEQQARMLTAFQCWTAIFRLRNMTVINAAAKAVQSVYSVIVSNFRGKVKCCQMLQNLYRRQMAKARVAKKREELYRQWEIEEMVAGRAGFNFKLRSFRGGLEVVRTRQRARLCLQCWCRAIIACNKARRRAMVVGNMNGWEATVARTSQRSTLEKMMRLMQFGCALRACEVKQSTPREKSIQFGSKNCDIEAIFRKVDRMKKGSVKDFASEEYHSHIFRLRQSGVLIIDASSTLLRHNELSYLIQNARTIFSQSTGEHTNVIRDVTRFFLGDKIIFCGGTISDNGARELFYMLSTREDPVSLHLSEVVMPYKGIARLARAISLNFAKMKEFSVDSVSVGSLGLATLLVAIKDNRTISSLGIKFNSDGVVLPCYSECFKCMLRNSFLKELRIFGSTLNREVLAGLHHAIQFGLSSLCTLEFEYLTQDKDIVFALMHMCGQRETKSKKSGSNVAVRATEFTPRDVMEDLIMKTKWET